MPSSEAQVKNLLVWATFLAAVSLLILAIDYRIKKDILEAVRGRKAEPPKASDRPRRHPDILLDESPHAPAPRSPVAHGEEQPETD